jgi:predicted DNA-binding transcriptional regulator YafY
MSKKQFVKRYNLIINRLRKKACSFEELSRYLQKESELDEENYEVSLRTFQRDLKEIASIYNIEIAYNRVANVYEITHEADDDRSERIMESFEVFNALNLTSNYAHHLILEKRKALGTENMYGLLHAIKNRLVVSFSHEKYWDDEGNTVRTVKSLALKEARHRWYLVARDKDGLVKTFGLERITGLEILVEKFKADSFDAEVHFRDCFGIITEDDVEAEKVLLSFTPTEAKYIKSLPLHHSQRVVSETDERTVFELQIYPTYDFVMELLSFGTELTVLEPASLREEVAGKLRETLAKYGG